MLETHLCPDNSFLTLTYSDQAMPKSGTGLGTLEPKHTQDWLKRLRSAWTLHIGNLEKLSGPTGTSTLKKNLRYYLVGEYGDETFRPHYHAALFGLPTCSRLGLPIRSGGCPCAICTLVRNTWGHGNTHVGTLEPASARYLAGYIEKKMTRSDDPRLGDRHPEFSRMSLRPGIGADMMDEVASTLLQFDIVDATQGDVPSSLRHGSRTLPLGRYLTRRLRTRVGKEANAPQETITQRAEEMRPLLEAAKHSETHLTLKAQVVHVNEAKALSQAAKVKIRKQRRTL